MRIYEDILDDLEARQVDLSNIADAGNDWTVDEYEDAFVFTFGAARVLEFPVVVIKQMSERIRAVFDSIRTIDSFDVICRMSKEINIIGSTDNVIKHFADNEKMFQMDSKVVAFIVPFEGRITKPSTIIQLINTAYFMRDDFLFYDAIIDYFKKNEEIITFWPSVDTLLYLQISRGRLFRSHKKQIYNGKPMDLPPVNQNFEDVYKDICRFAKNVIGRDVKEELTALYTKYADRQLFLKGL